LKNNARAKCVANLTLVQAGMGAPSKIEIADPVEREQGAFQASDFTQGDGKAVLARERG
jgi:hypothetical protein